MQRVSIPSVKHVLSVGSAKGGVGKSTTATNLALAIKNLGYNVGLVDADITGPSIPAMMNVTNAEVEAYRSAGVERFVPPENYGVKVMSMGLVVPHDEAIAVRGPVISKYLRALLFQTDWGELDYLILDMPPGTNDVHITLTQEVAISGAVIVSTPQHVALMDVRRGMEMFATVNIPVLGLVENMAYFTCTGCGDQHFIFGQGGVQKTAAELGLPFLGQIPYIPAVQKETDGGAPPALRGDEALPSAAPFYSVARKVVAEMERREGSLRQRVPILEDE